MQDQLKCPTKESYIKVINNALIIGANKSNYTTHSLSATTTVEYFTRYCMTIKIKYDQK